MILGGDLEVRIVLRSDGSLVITGPDLVTARPVWDYIIAELNREIAARVQAARSPIVRPTIEVSDGRP